MNKASPFSAPLSILLAVWIIQAPSNVQAQEASEENCAQAQSEFVSAMQMFRSAYFLRESDGNSNSAESVMADQVLPAAEQIYQVCPENIAGVIRGGVERANLSLQDPDRWRLVACDRALLNYKRLLNEFDNSPFTDYNSYRNVIYGEIDPSAQAAVEACPQMPDLARQTKQEITERKKRVDRMEDVENMGETMAEQIEAKNAEYQEWFEEEYE